MTVNRVPSFMMITFLHISARVSLSTRLGQSSVILILAPASRLLVSMSFPLDSIYRVFQSSLSSIFSYKVQ